MSATHDCFGSILKSGGGVLAFIDPETGKIYATLDKNGMEIIKGSGKNKRAHRIRLKTLEVLIKELKKS